MIDNLPIFYVMAALVILMVSLSKGGLGGTLGAAATPLMTLVMPADQVLGLLLPLFMVADVFAVASHWRRWDNRLVLLLVPASLVGITLGTLVITNVSAEALRRGIGLVVLLFVFYKASEGRIRRWLPYQPRNWHGGATGVVAGFSSTIAHTGGPPIAIYLLMQELDPRVFVATSALYFAIVNWLKVPYYFYAGLFHVESLRQVLWLLPLIPLGVWLGKQLATRIDKTTFDRTIVVLLAVAAFLLLFR